MRIWLSALLFLIASGCQPAPTEPAPAPSPTNESTPVENAPAEATGENTAENALGQLGDQNAELANALSSLSRVMAAMRMGSEEAAARESDPCRAARASMLAAMGALRGWRPPNGAPAPRWELAPEERYLTLCRSLPETLQRCSVFHYRTAHRDECQAAVASDAQAAAAYDEMAHPAPGPSDSP